jgi:hypothetical protein
LGHVIGRRGKYISKPASGIEFSAKSMLWAFVCELRVSAGPLETLRIGLLLLNVAYGSKMVNDVGQK